MRLCCCNFSCPSGKTVWNLARGAVTGAVLHIPSGAGLGALGALISSAGLSVGTIARIGAAGGAVLGTLVHAGRGYFETHFATDLTTTKALAEVGSGWVIINAQQLLGTAMVSAPAVPWAAFLSTTSVTAVIFLVIIGGVKFWGNANCLQKLPFSFGSGASAGSGSESTGQMLARLEGGK